MIDPSPFADWGWVPVLIPCDFDPIYGWELGVHGRAGVSPHRCVNVWATPSIDDGEDPHPIDVSEKVIPTTGEFLHAELLSTCLRNGRIQHGHCDPK